MCGGKQELPQWLLDKLKTEAFIPVRCLPPIGVHERCEHDPRLPIPSFRRDRYEPRRHA